MEWEGMDKPLRDLIEIIHFTESVSAKIHGVLDEAEIYRAVREEFARSKRYTVSILLLTGDGSKLRIAEASVLPDKLKAGEKVAGVRLKGYKIDLNKSSTYSQVVREGKTAQVNVSDVVGELFPRPLAHLISKTIGYENKPSILTPLKRHGKIIGALAISSTDLAEHFIPSVRNLAQHISNALELADEYAERKRAEEELRKYRDHLEELVEERTAELIEANEQLEREIAERKRAEEALRESEKRYRVSIESAPYGITVHDPNGNILILNSQLEKITGYSKEEMPDVQTWLEKVYPDEEYRRLVMEERKTIALEERPRIREAVITRKDGEKRICQLVSSLLPSGLRTVFINDITERKQAEEELHYQANLLQNVSDAIIATDLGFKIESWNKPAESLYGWRADEVIGKPLTDIVHPEYPYIPREEVLKRFFEDGYFKGQVIHRRRDGAPLVILGSVAMLKDSDGSPIGAVSVDRDITERVRAEEALRESEERLEILFEFAPDAYYLSDLEGKFIDGNRVAEELTGYKKEELVGKSFLKTKLLSLDQTPKAAALLGENARGQATGPDEFTLNRKDGTRVTVEIRTYPVKIKNQTLVLGIARDITERKRAEEALRESEEKYKALYENALVALFRTSIKDQKVLAANDVGVRLFGYSSKEEFLKEFATADHYADPGDREKLLEELRLKGEVHNYQIKFTRKDGTCFWAEFSARIYPDKGELEAVVIDITERKRAEQLLGRLNAAALAVEQALTHEEIFTAVAEELNKLGFSCMVLPTDESQSRVFPRYLSYEAGALKALEKLVGLQYEDFPIPIETVDAYREVVWERKTLFQRNAEEVIQQLLPGPAKRFAKQIVSMLKVPKSIAAPLIVEDQVIGVLSVQSDDLTEADVPAITAFAHQMTAAWRKANLLQDLEENLEELKRTQAQLVQAQRMEAVGRLAGGVAHDFNNLLTVISGFSEISLQRHLDDRDPLRRNIEEINKAANRAASLTRQLLAFSRKQVLQPRVLDLNVVVADMDKMLRRLIGEDIDLVTVLDPELGPVKADPGQIEQVIVNLAVNARDAMTQGGKLTIETADVELDEAYARQHVPIQPGPYVMVAVSDTGIGMDEETQSHIFDPFFTTKEEGQGTGLGLSTVYGIVKQSGGHIWVYSEPGQGTTFKIYLPRVEEAVELLKPSAAPTGLPQGSETVLVVEDDEGVRILAREVLEMDGYTVLEACHGGEALLICEQHEGRIHLMVTDVVMPMMSGRELAERLAPLHPEMKVLYVSGYTDNAIVHHGVLEAGLAFLQKPFTLGALARKVRQVLDAPQQEQR